MQYNLSQIVFDSFDICLQVMKEEAAFHDQKRLFYSTLMNDNLLDCIISKLSVVQIPPTVCIP